MCDILISYAREDHSVVEKLLNVLDNKGWIVFWDQSIRLGNDWCKILKNKLNGAKLVIVVWSTQSVNANWVLEEASMALRMQKLIPINIEQVELPLGFAHTLHREIGFNILRFYFGICHSRQHVVFLLALIVFWIFPYQSLLKQVLK